MVLWTALVLGFVGSFHCVGMCGPLVMSIPRTSSRILSLSINALIYNSGRILTYSLFGLAFGFLGKGIALSGFQSWLSIALGVSIIVAVISPRLLRSHNKPVFYQNFIQFITKTYGKLIRKESKPAQFGMGFLNGLLPCAFVYTGLSAAVLTVSPLHSMAYMALFGLGTLPAMFSMYLAPSFVSIDLRSAIRKYLPYLAFTLGVFLIIRGVALQDLQLTGVLKERIDFFCIFPGTGE